MSNKTQLQTNNSALDAFITRVNAAKDVAASLPEAGGSGGGSVETCAVAVKLDAPALEKPIIYYTDSNMVIQSVSLSSIENLTVPIGTLLVTYGGSSMDSITGNGELLAYNGGIAVFKINGTSTIFVVPM